MAERDPLNDPAKDDIVYKLGAGGGKIERIVTLRQVNMVSYQTRVGGPIKTCWIDVWRAWCAGADVGEPRLKRLRE